MLRIGAVSYLNTKPLIHSLAERLDGRGMLSLDLPSRLATDLQAGRLDVALIPSVEFFRNPGYRIISDAAIACRGPVWSVRLLSRLPVPQIKRLALDEGSRTSAAMLRTLLWEMHSLKPETVPLAIDQSPEQVDADAVLLIGDRAMHPAQGTYQEIWDLGDRWCRWTELPFVFAMWVARQGLDVDYDQLAGLLQASRNDGLANLEQIAADRAAGHGLTKEDLHRYFAENLHFRLGRGERLGLESFRERAAKLGLVPSHEPINANKTSMIASVKNSDSDDSIRPILDRAIAGGRLSREDGLRLLKSHDLAAIGSAADQVCATNASRAVPDL